MLEKKVSGGKPKNRKNKSSKALLSPEVNLRRRLMSPTTKVSSLDGGYSTSPRKNRIVKEKKREVFSEEREEVFTPMLSKKEIIQSQNMHMAMLDKVKGKIEFTKRGRFGLMSPERLNRKIELTQTLNRLRNRASEDSKDSSESSKVPSLKLKLRGILNNNFETVQKPMFNDFTSEKMALRTFSPDLKQTGTKRRRVKNL